jgi:predicted MPP superfamily phosphohydrolase
MPPVRVLVFFLVLSSIAVAVQIYAWRRLVRDVTPSRRLRRGGTFALVLLAATVPTGLAAWRGIGAEAALPLSYVGSAWAGVLFFLVVSLAGADLLRGLAAGVRRLVRGRPVAAPPDPERRRFLARTVAGVAGTSALGLSAAALIEGARAPEVVRVRVPIARLPAAFEGFRIVQWTDVHVGPLVRRPAIEDLVRRTNLLAPDLILVTGDLVDGSVEELADVVAPMAGLRARHGVWFTTGNHEYYVGVEPWLRHLPRLGITPLRNARVPIVRDGQTIALAGIDDASAAHAGGGHGPDLDRALAGRDPARPVVLLAHQPKQVADAQRLGVDLQLSGHTHGGQIAPFGWLVRLVQPAVAGLHRFGGTWLYVSRGAGFWGPPMRLANPAELTVVELTA